MIKKLSILAAAVGYALCVFLPAFADEESDKAYKEYLIKAAFLYNFAKYIEWPDNKSPIQTHEANICIIGNDPFGAALDIFRKASSPSLTFNVKRNISESEIASCHILFVGQSEEENVPAILARARAHSVATVSELSGFADEGGVFEMVKVQKSIGLFSKDKINLRVNLRAADAEHLHIDAQLLEIAAEVMK